MNDAVNYVDLFGLCGSDITFSSSVFNNPIIGNDLVSNNWIVGDGWAIATSGATLNGLTQTTGVPWTTTSWDQSRNPTTLQIGETITWNTSLPFSNLTFSEGSTSTTSPTITAQSFSQSSNFASVGMSGQGSDNSGAPVSNGSDIRETTLSSKSISLFGALRGSVGFAKDGKGELAIFVKLEAGIGGIGGEMLDFGNALKLFNIIAELISNTNTGIDAIENFMSTPENIGQGNFSDFHSFFNIISFKHEDCSDWNGHLPVEAAFLIGVNGDKEGNIEYTAGVSANAAVYLIEETMYINISAIKDYIKATRNK